jgi:hypothetical protein
MIEDEEVGVISRVLSIVMVESELMRSSREEPETMDDDWFEERLLKPSIELGDFVMGKEEEEEVGDCCC